MGWLSAKLDNSNVKPIPIPAFPLKGKEQSGRPGDYSRFP